MAITAEHNIWTSADAAARVREVTGGDEIVPTVFVGDRALVNPSASQVVDAIRAVDPDYEPNPPPSLASRIRDKIAFWRGSTVLPLTCVQS